MLTVPHGVAQRDFGSTNRASELAKLQSVLPGRSLRWGVITFADAARANVSFDLRYVNNNKTVNNFNNLWAIHTPV